MDTWQAGELPHIGPGLVVGEFDFWKMGEAVTVVFDAPSVFPGVTFDFGANKITVIGGNPP